MGSGAGRGKRRRGGGKKNRGADHEPETTPEKGLTKPAAQGSAAASGDPGDSVAPLKHQTSIHEEGAGSNSLGLASGSENPGDSKANLLPKPPGHTGGLKTATGGDPSQSSGESKENE